MSQATPQLIQDSAQNFLTLIGSDSDPTEGISYGDCKPNMWRWYEQGGVGSKIVEFWPSQETTAITINVATIKGSGAAKGRSQRVKDWLEKEFKRLNLLQVLYDAELQCQLDRAAPIMIYTDGRESLGSLPSRFSKVDRLEVVDPSLLLPAMHQASLPWEALANIDHTIIPAYTLNNNSMIVSSERVLVLQGKKRIASDRSGCNDSRIWGKPLIGVAVAEAAMKLDLAIAAMGILIQKKNTMIISASGLLAAVQAMSNGDNVAATDLAKIISVFTKGGNIQNVQLLDKEQMDAQYIERNLAGVAECVQKLKDQLLAHCYLIPETFLFGMQSRGGLGRSNDEREQVDTTADMFFRKRLLPLIEKLVALMLRGSSCPEQGFDIGMISITRNPSYSKTDEEKTRIRLSTVQADKILIDAGVLKPEEVRIRESSAGYQLSLNL